MTKLIKIDRKTIRKNPDYEPGEFTKHVSGPIAIYVDIIGEIPEYISEFGCTSVYIKSSSECAFEQRILLHGIDIDILEKIQKDPKVVNINIEREIINVTTIDEPKYLYSYIPTEIECLYCNKKFLHTELVSDLSSKSDYYSDEICPHCGDWNCCDIEFEELTYAEVEELL